MSLSPAIAQESTRLQIEITRDGGLLARPELRVPSGGEGRVVLGSEFVPNGSLKGMREDIRIAPTVRGDNIALAFSIGSGDRQFRPSLTISKDIRGSFEWVAADGQPVRLTVAWVQ